MDVPSSRIGISYNTLQRKFSERIKLEKLAEIWNAGMTAIADWESERSAKWIPTKDNPPAYLKKHIIYTYDQLPWELGMLLFENKGGTVLCLKFSNDGFLYKKHEDMHIAVVNGIKQDNQSTHNDQGWCVLDPKRDTEFDVFKQFCKNWLLNDGLQYQISYNYDLGRIDIKAHDPKNDRRVIISFEPGFPSTLELEDRWHED